LQTSTTTTTMAKNKGKIAKFLKPGTRLFDG